MIIKEKAYPRAGLIGNPSDGYFGKTISFAFSNFSAEVVLYESPELEILPSDKDHSHFGSLEELLNYVRLHGYYGGIRLLKATVKKFHDYSRGHQIKLHQKNFTIRYKSNIPHGVGLAGSSAIITACLRALMRYYEVSIPKIEQVQLVYSAEVDELHIPAGLQDRVIQVYEGLVYMDFNQQIMKERGHGIYEEMDPGLLPLLYVAYRENLSEGTEVFHNNIRERFELGEKAVVAAMRYWAQLTEEAKEILRAGKKEKLGGLLNKNFDKRSEIYRISPGNLDMVAAARSVGASAKFTGSGGAIVGTYENEEMFAELKRQLGKMKIKVIKPKIAINNRGMS